MIGARVDADPLLLVGAGGHAMACIDVIEEEGRFELRGLVGERQQVGQTLLGYPVLGSDNELPELLCRMPNALVSVGQIKTPAIRISLFEQLLSLGARLATVRSPRAHTSRHAEIDVGSIVMHGATINAGASIGRNCIINTMAIIEHGVVVGDHCHVATAAVLNGDVRVGRGSFVGSGARVRQGVTIGERCVIGIGQVVERDVPDDTQLSARSRS